MLWQTLLIKTGEVDLDDTLYDLEENYGKPTLLNSIPDSNNERPRCRNNLINNILTIYINILITPQGKH